MKKRILAIIVSFMLLLSVGLLTVASENQAGGYSYKDMNGQIDLAGYFTVEGADISMQEESMDFVLTGTEATLTFNKPLAADGFSLSFSGVAENTLNRAEVVLTEAEDTGAAVKFLFSRMNDSFAGFTVNDGSRSYIAEGSFYMENASDFTVTYDEDTKCAGYGTNYMVPIMENTNGSSFKGFASQKVNMSVHLEGESGSVFRLTQINRQRFGTMYTEDTVQPMICIINPIDKAMKGAKIALPKAIAMDVLADNATVTMNVKAPDGTAVKAVDGKELTNVTPDKAYQIKVEQYGDYSLEYKATDGTNETRAIVFAISVLDEMPPEIELKKQIPVSHKVGDKLTFPELICSDNVTEKENIITWVTVIHPDGKMTQGQSYVELTQEGVYEIGFQALDEAGNITFITAKTYVEGE